MLVGVPAHAQGLRDFLEAAAQRNVDVRQGEETSRQARLESQRAVGALLPSLTASGGYTYNEVPAVIPAGAFSPDDVVIVPRDQLTASFRAELPLIDAGRWLDSSSASARARAAGARQLATRAAVERQVVSTYYSVVGGRAVVESARRSLALAQAQLKDIEERRSAGVATDLDLERARSEVERNQQLLADAEAQAATSGRALRRLTGLAPGDLPGLPEDGLEDEAPVETLEARAAELPRVRAAEAEAQAAERDALGAKLALAPTVSAQFTQQLTNATGFQGATHLFNAGLLLNWRLDVATVQSARAQVARGASAALDLERARGDAEDQIFSDWHQVRAAVTRVRSSRSQVAAARRAVSLAHERYGAGMATQLDTIQADRDLFAAEVNDIQARSTLAAARLALRLSAGLPLEALP